MTGEIPSYYKVPLRLNVKIISFYFHEIGNYYLINYNIIIFDLRISNMISSALTHYIRNVLSYPAILFEQACSFIMAGSGKIKATVLALKNLIYGNSASMAPTSLLSLPPEIILEIAKRLEPSDASALLKTCSIISNLYHPKQRSWIAIEKFCSDLSNQYELIYRDDFEEVPENFFIQFKAVYKEALLRLLDPETTDQDLKHIAIFSGKLFRYLPGKKMEEGLLQVLNQLSQQEPAPDLQRRWQKLAHIDLHLCASLSGIAGLEQLQRYGVTDCSFLLDQLPPDRVQAKALLSSIKKDIGTFNTPLALHYALVDDSIEMASALLQASPHCVDILDGTATSALALAAGWGDVAAVRLLLEYKANVKSTALHGACSKHKDVAEVLLAHGVDINLQKPRMGETPLIEPAYMGIPL